MVIKIVLLAFVYHYNNKDTPHIMKRAVIQDTMFPTCPVRNILARICDKWALLVIYNLYLSDKEKMRFTELKQQMPDISQRMLTTTLRTLEEDRYITRTVYPEVPPRVEYTLTDRAKTLRPILESLLQWSMHNMDDIMQDRRVLHARPRDNRQ